MVATQPRRNGWLSTDLPDAPPDLTVSPRRGLPGSRAVVGGLLVAAAAVGVFAAWSGAGHAPASRYVVAARSVTAGAVLHRADLTTVAIDLPRSLAGRTFASPGALEHAVTLGPLAAGELVQSGNVLPSRGTTPRPELSFGIDSERAVAGMLRPGDTIDVLVTYGTGAGSVTHLVSPDASVLAIDGGARSGLSDARRQVLTIALSSPDNILELTNAARAGELTVARSTGVKQRPAARTFQLDVPDGADVASGASTPSTTTSAPRKRSP